MAQSIGATVRGRAAHRLGSATRVLLFMALVGLSTARAQTDQATAAEQEKLVRASHHVPAQGSNLFGDTVNQYTGQLRFSQTDIAIPGNSALPVKVTRTFTAGEGGLSKAMFGDWDLELPSIRGTFAVGPRNYGWAVDGMEGTSEAYRRCTYFSEPPEARPTTGLSRWMPWEYWFGTTLNADGGGEILTRSTANSLQPQNGQAWPLVTKSGWQLRCLSSLNSQNVDSEFARGEGFVALDPQGNEYTFDWMVQRTLVNLTKRRGGSVDQLQRSEFLIYPTQIRDRFGNWVRYNFNPAVKSQLLSITASDGRSISFTYDGNNRISSATANDGTRNLVWTYGYGSDFTVAQPDGSRWTIQTNGLKQTPYVDGDPACGNSTVYPQPTTGTLIHPSGAVGTFTTTTIRHGRKVNTTCMTQQWTYFPRNYGTRSLTAKTLSGPGMASSTWRYDYDTSLGSEASCASCPTTKALRITNPAGEVNRYTYGIVSLVNEGQLLRLEEGWDGSTARRTTNYRYRDKAAGPYPAQVGYSPNPRSDAMASLHHFPLDQRVITQQGVTFTWEANGFDQLARPTSVLKYSSLGYSRAETLYHYDHLGKWVLGQPGSVTLNKPGTAEHGTVLWQRGYRIDTGSLTTVWEGGLLTERYAYHDDGQLAAKYDQAGRITYFHHYHRGRPKTVVHPDGQTETLSLNDLGLITSSTNEVGVTTRYWYDDIGRLAGVLYPGESWGGYCATSINFQQVMAAEYGVEPGHWRKSVTTCGLSTTTYFDALWRPLLRVDFDNGPPVKTVRGVLQRWDFEGRKVFESFAQSHIGGIGDNWPGTQYTYDVLGRLTRSATNSELGLLVTNTAYLDGFVKRETNPRGYISDTSFQAFDQPDQTAPRVISGPESVVVDINRSVLGQPYSISRGGVTRSYTYDSNLRLCATHEPEAGTTTQGYDDAGNLAWRAAGLAQGSSCGTAPPARTISFGYDVRNRLTSTSYGDGSPSVQRSYTADGLLATLTSGPTQWSYGYNNRRLLVNETINVNGSAYSLRWDINDAGHVSGLQQQGDPYQYFAPNALGQPTQVSGYASGITHHPNGAVAGYTLSNGRVFSLSQNIRGLPADRQDAGLSWDRYSWDANGNVAGITDLQEGITHRNMGYDGVDRLVSASGPWGSASFGYDVADNLRSSTVGGRVLSHQVDGRNRLASLSGSQNVAIGYDSNGNVTSRGAQGFVFDIGNRLQQASGVASHSYDGHGRRAFTAYTSGATQFQVYDHAGRLRYTNHTTRGATRYVYLGSQLLAETNSTSGHSFAHTDALGSPVARSDAAGNLISRTRYEPYGATHAGTNPTTIGFTGHANEPETGLVYMQQRYYEPIAGRFLSVDPVTTDAKSGGHFNRYAYADNNPYKYTDPDGRSPVHAGLKALDLAVSAIDIMSAFHTGGAGAGLRATLETVLAPPGSRLVAKVADKVGDAAKAVQHFSGAAKPWTKGATPNSLYTHVDPKTGKAVQNAVYDSNGKVVGHVDFKNHGPGAPSGHGHVMTEPGNPASGHGAGKPHIPNADLPAGWDKLPPKVEPHTKIGN